MTSLALILMATLLLFPAIIVNWTRTQIYDSATFADNAVAALETEAVQAAISREIVNEFIRVGPPETLSIRPLIEFVTATVVDTQAFVEIYRDAVEELHRDIFEGDDGSGPVALTLVDALIVIIAFIEQAYPEVAQQLPPDLSTAFVEVRQRDWAVQAVALGEDVDYLAFLLPLTALMLYGLAVWVAPDRRRAIMAIGVGFVSVAGILVIGRDYVRDTVIAQVGLTDQATADVLWDVYTRPLLGWAALFGGTGVLLAVGATGRHQRVDPRQQFEVLRRAVAFTPDSQAGRVVRGSVLVLLGIMGIVYRDELLSFVALAAAAYLLYYGLTELIWLAGPGPAKVERPEPAGARTRGRLALRAGSVAALVVAGLGGAYFTYQAIETVGGPALSEPVVTTCNGYEELCDRRLDEVAFLGTHNSMSAAEAPGWFFAEHKTGIPEQLENGVRTLLIDTWYGYDTGRGVRTADRDLITSSFPSTEYSEAVIAAARRLASLIGEVQPGTPRGAYLCHGFCEMGATPLPQSLRQIDEFLERNPGEVIVLFVQAQITPEDTAKAFISSGLVRRVYHHVEGQPFPTLRELIERDQRVVVFAEGDSTGVDWYLPAYEYIQDTPFRVETPGRFECDLGRGDVDNPLFALNHWITGQFPSQSDAEFVNRYLFLYDRLVRCMEEREAFVNFVLVNFYEIGDARLVVDVLNGVRSPPGAAED